MNNFSFVVASLDGYQAFRYTFFQGSSVVRFSDIFGLWQDTGFMAFYRSVLQEIPFRAYRWETPMITTETMGRTFEFVVLEDSSLDRRASSAAFDEHFRGVGEDELAVSFHNLGRDAVLIVPTPHRNHEIYTHLGSFTRGATQVQYHALWAMVGSESVKHVSDAPMWLNTAGDGVPWLHVRLDSRPKYYRFRPYTQIDSRGVEGRQ